MLRSARKFVGDLFFSDWRSNQISLEINNEEIVELMQKSLARVWLLNNLLFMLPVYDAVSCRAFIGDHETLERDWADAREAIERECFDLAEFSCAVTGVSGLVELDRRRLMIRNRAERAYHDLEVGLFRQCDRLREILRTNDRHAILLLEELRILREYAKSDESVQIWLRRKESEWDACRDSVSKRLEDADRFYIETAFGYRMENAYYRNQVAELLKNVRRDVQDALYLKEVWSLQVFRKNRYPITRELIEEASAELKRITAHIPYEPGSANIHRDLMGVREKILAAYDHFWQ
ncbi:MAG: hypothetical protein HGA31_05975 [Candidatus Moranbacteria bacterium]|nr:hypothetical protein [Candidatus Moranbacteria bacterium]